MAEVPVSSLDVRQQKLVENARIALERGNLDYALDACAQILKVAPGCLAVRRLQRVAQLRQFQSKNRFMAKALGGLSTAPFFMGAAKKDPAKALESAEKALAGNPTSVPALKMLADAALALDLPETAAFAHEAVRELAPDDRANLLALGEALLAAGKPADALRLADTLLRGNSVDGDAQNLMRKASVAQTLTKGNWESTNSFRDKLKDEAQAVSLEQAAKVVTSGDMTQRLIDEARARLAQEPANLNHYRALVQGCRQLGRLDEALEWVRQARRQPTGAADSSLEKQESELMAALLERKLRECEAAVAVAPADAAAAAKRDAVRAELAAFRLSEAQRAVERYPNDFAARQALGERLVEAGQVDLAIAQFQQAQKSPQVRIAALTGLGRAFKAKKLYDLAVAQLGTAKAELAGMTDQKKEIIYELGTCHELMGHAELAIAEFKIVYTEDIGFRDVAEKINAYYAARAGGS
jgi:tetratricopeptide (TPR) repeat protein